MMLQMLELSPRAICTHRFLGGGTRTPVKQQHWINPGRTQAWWDNFISGMVPADEVCMRRENFYKL